MTIPIALHEWATRWNLPPACLADLLQCMGAGDVPPVVPPTSPIPPPKATEAWSSSVIALEAPRFGVWMTRNNVGAKVFTDDHGQRREVRWGLANESKARNDVLKSADRIGIRAVLIQPWHVGTTIGQFVSRECKRPGWTYKGDAHEVAQMNWALLINKYGGDAKFATGEGSFS